MWAFEPVTSIREIFESNVRKSNLLGAITIEPAALGNREGVAQLYLPDDRHGLIETSASLNESFREVHAASMTVTLSTLDKTFLHHPQWSASPEVLIKIDVESAEPEVLAGAEGLITRHRPAVVCEILPGADIDFFHRFMRQFDYLHLDCDNGLQFAYAGDEFNLSLSFRDHLFLPSEKLEL